MASTKPRNTIVFTGKGVTSRREIGVEIERKQSGHGIVFRVKHADEWHEVPARSDHVVNTLRNVTLGTGNARLCIVEHFLAAASLCGLSDLLVSVDGPEVPLADGSAKLWTDLFNSYGWMEKPPSAMFEIPAPIVCKKGDRLLMAIPDDTFSVSYHMDWDHPAIGKCWQTWDPTKPIEEIAYARTFGSMKEHQMLGLQDDVVSFTEDGFSQPLRFEDEPVRHKLLDLIGDLALSGVNPMLLKARFVSIKAGHELDVAMARQLLACISAKTSAART